MKTYVGVEVWRHLFLTLELDKFHAAATVLLAKAPLVPIE